MKRKKFLTGALAVLLCVSMNINPVATIVEAVAKSDFISDLGVLKDNLIYMASNDFEEVKAATVEGPAEIGPITVDCDCGYSASDVVGSSTDGIDKATLNGLQNYLDVINGNVSSVAGSQFTDSDATSMQNAIYRYIATLRNANGSNAGYTIQDIIDEINDSNDEQTGIIQTGGNSNTEGYDLSLYGIQDNITTQSLVIQQCLGYPYSDMGGGASLAEDMADVKGYLDEMEGTLVESLEELEEMNVDLDEIIGKLNEIYDKLDQISHTYRVAHLYSLNSQVGALWQPTLNEVPYVLDYATNAGPFVAVYDGYWDLSIDTMRNPGNQATQRALEVLGYDAIVRHEGFITTGIVRESSNSLKFYKDGTVTNKPEDVIMHGSNYAVTVYNEEKDLKDTIYTDNSKENGSGVKDVSPTDNISIVVKDRNGNLINHDRLMDNVNSNIVTYYKEEIPLENITWLDAVTLLYKALGQEEIQYQSYISKNSSIVPETSPLSLNLSNIEGFNGYDVNMFLTRSNIISTDKEGKFIYHNTYWQKAMFEGFITNYSKMDMPITSSEFFILASKMMQAYGEPVINDDEIKALLQVYGSSYPIQLGTEVADAWAYLKARGILEVELDFGASMTRDQLLDICMRIKDKDSRADYKVIEVVLDLADVLRDDGYFPVYDLEFTNGSFSTYMEYDHVEASNYHYLVYYDSTVNIGSTNVWQVSSGFSDNNGTRAWTDIEGASCNNSITVDGKTWYVVSVPKKHNGPIYIRPVTTSEYKTTNATMQYIEIPTSCLGGGFMTSITNNGSYAVVNPEGINKFDVRSGDELIAGYTDYVRAGITEEEINDFRNKNKVAASNAPIDEKILCFWDELTTPMISYAAEDLEDISYVSGERLLIRFSQDNDNKMSKDYDEFTIYSSIGSVIDTVDIEDQGYDNHHNWNTENQYYSINKVLSKMYAAQHINIPYTSDGEYDYKEWISSCIKYVNSYGENGGQLLNRTVGSTTTNGSVDCHITNAILGDYVAVDHPNGENPYYSYNIRPYYRIARKLDNNDYEVRTLSNKSLNEVLLSNVDAIISESENDLLSQALGTFNGQVKYRYNSEWSLLFPQDEYAHGFLARLGSFEKSQAEEASSNMLQTNLNHSVASTVIMNREEQIMISWSDMLRSGLVVNEYNGGQPSLQDDGSYYFMTKYGQVQVNPIQCTIQIGTTLYDLYDGQNSPKLYYIDNSETGNGEIYFDYRCIMGMVTSDISRNETKTKVLQDSIGAGNYAVYDLAGGTTSVYELIELNCYNGPGTSVPNYKVAGIRTTAMDGDANDVGYWPDSQSGITRLQMASFVPTANWITVINQDESGVQASLYVYYLKEPFEHGFAMNDSMEEISNPTGRVENIAGVRVDDVYETVSAINKKTTNGETIGEVLASFNGIEFNADSVKNYFTNDNWYEAMTWKATASLFDKTGKYYYSPDYVVREFVITNASAASCVDWAGQDYSTPEMEVGVANNAGMIYWVDKLGFVYNLPSVKSGGNVAWTLKGYLEGRFPLPIATGDNITDIRNFNMNYYGHYYDKSGTVSSTVIPYGYFLTDQGFAYYYSPSGATLSSSSYLPCKSSDGSYPMTSDSMNQTYIYPFDLDEYVPAPVGVYYYFGGNTIAKQSLNEFSNYLFDVYHIYYGTHRLKYYSTATQSSSVQLQLDTNRYAPFTMRSDSANTVKRVYRDAVRDMFIADGGRMSYGSTTDVAEVTIDDGAVVEIDNILDKIGANKLLEAIDSGSSIMIMVGFQVVPLICLILMTILIGLSFLSGNKLVSTFAEKVIDPVRLLTFGAIGIDRWHWKNVLVPCTLMYIAFALFLNGNLIRLVQWGAKWYGVVTKWLTSL